MDAYFEEIQEDILHYKERFAVGYITIDKTNEMFHTLSLEILEYFGTGDASFFDRVFEYNIQTMHEQFEDVIARGVTNEKAQGTLMMFFLRCAEELMIREGEIENPSLKKLHTIMTAKGYKYPEYISFQKNFALERLPDIIKRMEMLKGTPIKNKPIKKEKMDSLFSSVLKLIKGSD